MLYLLFGPNQFGAVKKIQDVKKQFKKKAGAAGLVEELEEDVSEEDLVSAIEQKNLFCRVKLVVFKNVFSASKGLLKILKSKADFLKTSPDIFVLWEKTLTKKDSIYKILADKAAQVQEFKSLTKPELDKWLAKKSKELGLDLNSKQRALMIEGVGEEAEWALENELEKIALSDVPPQLEISRSAAAASPFLFLGKIFSPHTSLLGLESAIEAGNEPERLIYPILWKLRQTKQIDLHWRGILAESEIVRTDAKNAKLRLEKFISLIGRC